MRRSPAVYRYMASGEPSGPPSRAGDLALVRRLRAGDDDAFEELFDRAFPALRRFALARTGDEHLAEEIAQATLCRAFQRLETWRGEASLLTWLYTICQRQLSDHFERRGRRPPQVSLAAEAAEVRAALEALASAAAGPEEELARDEVVRRVRATLAGLPRHYNEALTMKYLQDLSVVEIGTRLAVSPKAAESLLTRAREAFRAGFTALVGQLGGRAGLSREPSS